MLARMFDQRCRGYEAIGYEIVLPASAIPGWPADVVLPSDPVWKHNYAASVRRLVRDGVDVPLAELFVQAARPIPADVSGANRTRSASEAFLYRRLQTLAETKGRFQVNVSLPIAFDGVGQLEVDLLCTDAHLAVEIDGAQHLADPVAYRRDRRKDQLLQEQGYLVLRFLAEDVGKELDGSRRHPQSVKSPAIDNPARSVPSDPFARSAVRAEEWNLKMEHGRILQRRQAKNPSGMGRQPRFGREKSALAVLYENLRKTAIWMWRREWDSNPR